VTDLTSTLIGAGAVVGGVILAFAGNAWLDRLRERRGGKRARDAAIADLLAAVVDLITGAQTIRVAYQRQTSWRSRLRSVTALTTAFGATFAHEEQFSAQMLVDWRKQWPMLDRMLAISDYQDQQQRTLALDLTTVLLPRTSRFYSAVAVLTLGPDKKIAAAVRELTPAIGALVEAIAERRQRRYNRARRKAENALGRFRDIADQRH
jgi:hypothetical protein